MKFLGNLFAVTFLPFVLISSSYAATSVYQMSGTVDYMVDYNENTDYFGVDRVYPDSISVGAPFSVILTLSGDLGALSGTIDFDLGGVYQGHHNIGGGTSLCDGHTCTAGGYTDANGVYHGDGEYGDPLFPYVGRVFLGNEGSAVTTNLPFLNYNGLWTFVSLDFAPYTSKPAITTSLSDLPVSSISFSLGSYYHEYQEVSCPECVEGYTFVPFGQGWSLTGASNAIVAVPEPAAVWSLGFGLLLVLRRTHYLKNRAHIRHCPSS